MNRYSYLCGAWATPGAGSRVGGRREGWDLEMTYKGETDS